MKMRLRLIRNRLAATWAVLCSHRFVVIVYNKPLTIKAMYNVDLPTFRALTKITDDALEHQDEQEATESALKQAKELLK
jgi:hypothetical protein